MNLNINKIVGEFYTPSKQGDIALLIASYQPNEDASKLLRIAINSILKFKPDNADIWVVDVGSPNSSFKVLPNEYPSVNFIMTDYTPRSWGHNSYKRILLEKLLFRKPPRWGSYANAWTLEYAIKLFSDFHYNPKYFMTLQMDILFTSKKLIPYMLSLFNENTAAVGVLKQKNISKTTDILHSLGCMWKNEVFSSLKLSMEPSWPKFDVGEFAIKKAVDNGYNIRSLECSYSDPNIIEFFPPIFKEMVDVDRSIDSMGNVVFMHLGRGIAKSDGSYDKKGKITVTKWELWFNKFNKLKKKNKIN